MLFYKNLILDSPCSAKALKFLIPLRNWQGEVPADADGESSPTAIPLKRKNRSLRTRVLGRTPASAGLLGTVLFPRRDIPKAAAADPLVVPIPETGFLRHNLLRLCSRLGRRDLIDHRSLGQRSWRLAVPLRILLARSVGALAAGEVVRFLTRLDRILAADAIAIHRNVELLHLHRRGSM